ncbi:MAG: hypothetical protein Q7K44_04050 [Candidatus Liptonbacteria bacterium]|nr:hypothetical protein [Candidatus Liptonbacteria bacterium]
MANRVVTVQEFWEWLLKRFWKLVVTIAILAVVALMAGCAGFSDPAKPRTAAEEFPLRNQDPRVGLVVNNGTAPMNLYVYDQANRLVEQVYLSGAERHIVSASGQPYPQYWMRLLEPGCYRLEAFPFFKTVRWTAFSMIRVDLPKQTYSVCVVNNPTAQYYGGRHWGWLLYIGANIPEGGTGLPLVQILNPFSRGY